MKSKTSIISLLESFFKDRLISQKGVSPHTRASYSYTFQLLLKFATFKLKKQTSNLCLESFNAGLISKFLDDLERQRKTNARTRNQRLAAIRSFFKYLSTKIPEAGALINEVLAIPAKRFLQKSVIFFSDLEVKALLSAPDQETWIGKRDHLLLVLAIQTGFRLSELLGLTRNSIVWDQNVTITCIGKGRKSRSLPLSKSTEVCLRTWIKDLGEIDILFPTIHGKKMSSDSFQYLLKKYAAIAARTCPSLNSKNVTPHMLRHTAAMRLLQAGNDLASIAIWLGHESIKTTYIYFTADMEMKRQILEKLPSLKSKNVRFKPTNKNINFLKKFARSDYEDGLGNQKTLKN